MLDEQDKIIAKKQLNVYWYTETEHVANQVFGVNFVQALKDMFYDDLKKSLDRQIINEFLDSLPQGDIKHED